MAEDRVCPQAETMEKELLEFCKQKFDKKKGGGRGVDTQENNAAASEVMDSMLVEAAWDSDEKYNRCTTNKNMQYRCDKWLAQTY